MANFINNSASIHYNNTTITTCTITTHLEPPLDVHKRAVTKDFGAITISGTIGEDRTITYELILTNYSSKDFTSVVVLDTITLLPPSQNSISLVSSTYPTDITFPPAVKFTVPSISAYTHMPIYYTVKLDDTVPVGATVSNIAYINYNENPSIVNNVTIPIYSEFIQATLSYTKLIIDAYKQGPASALCGQIYPYTLVFDNIGTETAVNVRVTDDLPDNFTFNTISVINGTTTLVDGTSFYKSITPGTNILTITGSPANMLDIAPNTQLKVVIKGSLNC